MTPEIIFTVLRDEEMGTAQLITIIDGQRVDLDKSHLFLASKEEVKALTIAKWDCLVSYWREYPGSAPVNNTLGGSCAYCQIYGYDNCYGCPVRARTNLPNCQGSPFWHYNMIPGERTAAEELEFLKGLP